MGENADEIEKFRQSSQVFNINEKEVSAAKHRKLSPSSNGSIGTPRHKRPNPLIKAIGTQRKDFEYVTNLRREVIEIVEPFRSKVLNVDRRFERDEQLIEDLSTKLTRLDHEYTNKFKGILSMERTNELIK